MDSLRRYGRQPTDKIAQVRPEPKFFLHIIAALETKLP
jgi:hypothetical protein